MKKCCQSKEYKKIKKNNDNLYNNFDIKLRNSILILKLHKDNINCAIVLNDGRLATSSKDNSIIIYNKKTYKPDLVIKEHIDVVNCILQLSTGMLVSCSGDKTIKIFKLKYNNYEVFQSLNNPKYSFFKIIELSNKKLVSSSHGFINIYAKNNNNKYSKEFEIKTKDSCWNVIQTKENEICYSDDVYKSGKICFYNLLEHKIINEIDNINTSGINCFNMITKDLLLITGKKKLMVVNFNQYNMVRIINVPDSSYIMSPIMLNENIILTGDYKNQIKQWRIEGDNLKLISMKENAHNNPIKILINLGDGHILSASENDGVAKIW